MQNWPEGTTDPTHAHVIHWLPINLRFCLGVPRPKHSLFESIAPPPPTGSRQSKISSYASSTPICAYKTTKQTHLTFIIQQFTDRNSLKTKHAWQTMPNATKRSAGKGETYRSSKTIAETVPHLDHLSPAAHRNPHCRNVHRENRHTIRKTFAQPIKRKSYL